MASLLDDSKLGEPVTKYMRRDPARLRVGQTVAEALESIRRSPPEGRIVYFYVVDHADRLRGVVPTRRLLLSPLDRPIEEIMVRRVISLPAHATVLEACEFFVLHRLLAFPVVDRQQRLLGVIEVELYTEEISELGRAAHDDLFDMIGVHVAAARRTSLASALRSRFPWLLCNIAGGVAAAFLAGWFQGQLQRAVALALFIPVVLALAESVSIQSLSLTLETLHGTTLTWASMLQRLRRELVVGLFLGGMCGLLVGAVVLLWLRQLWLMLAVAGGIAGGVTTAALLGLAAPSILRLLRLDPKVAAGPVALALTDVLTLLVYFWLAYWLLP